MALKTISQRVFSQGAFVPSLILSALLVLFFVLLFGIAANSELPLIFLAVMPPALAFFYQDYLREKRTAQIEASLPSALFQLSSFPSKAPAQTLVRSIAQGGYGELSAEFTKALRQMESGLSPSQALSQVAKRSDSLLLSRVISLLIAAQQSGADASKSLRQVAEDSFKLSAIAKETSASLTLQKYTLLAAGAFIIPLVLGLLFASTASFSSSSLHEFGLGQSATQQAQMRQTVFMANQYYLAVFSLLASLLIASAQGSPKKFILYAAFIAPCSLLAFALAAGTKLS